jgi:hypothetical protein
MYAGSKSRFVLFLVMLTLVVPFAALTTRDEEPKGAEPKQAPAATDKDGKSTAATESKRVVSPPKPLSDQTKKGLEYLINQQHEDGGWGQGGGWRSGAQGGRTEGDKATEPSDIGNTCIAMLALIRSGSSPKDGPYAKPLARAADFVMNHVEKADNESLYVTSVRDTQLQSKIGQYVDTFLAGLVLSEIKGKMPNKTGEDKLAAALDKTIGKIERHQQADGTFAGNAGWASVLSQGLCSKALNRAKLRGVAVKEQTLARDKNQAEVAFNAAKSPTATSTPVGVGAAVGGPATAAATRPTKGRAPSSVGGGSDAGVSLYSLSANAGRLQDKVNSNAVDERKARETLESKTAPAAEKQAATRKLVEIADEAKSQSGVVGDILTRLDDKQFLAGFGNNGGEEFLSYMNLSETMFVQGGKEWERWDRSISEQVQRVQNEDGSWSGHHCITGRTFCTATALLTLLADRTPIPVADNTKNTKPSPKDTK